jgi:hypothetical protein
MAKKTPLENRIPRDITIGDLVAYAESIGCIVEVKLVDHAAELPLERNSAIRGKDDCLQCGYPNGKNITHVCNG